MAGIHQMAAIIPLSLSKFLSLASGFHPLAPESRSLAPESRSLTSAFRPLNIKERAKIVFQPVFIAGFTNFPDVV
ncbi:MAG: hypothetical protein WKF34_10490 [Pyrinomonadaceae bacterium]